MRISDWSSDVCSSDLPIYADINTRLVDAGILPELQPALKPAERTRPLAAKPVPDGAPEARPEEPDSTRHDAETRSEEHTSELQSLMRNSYAVFCLKKKKNQQSTQHTYRVKSTHNNEANTH